MGVKFGATGAGAKSAASHTGAMATSDHVVLPAAGVNLPPQIEITSEPEVSAACQKNRIPHCHKSRGAVAQELK